MSNVKIKKKPRKAQSVRKPAVKKPPEHKAAVEQPVAEAPSISHTMPSAWRHLRATLKFWRVQWRYVLLFVALYVVLSLIFVHNFASDVTGLKSQLASMLHGNQALTGLSTYALVVTTASGATGASAVYQYTLLILFSLAFIWALRTYMTDGSRRVSLRSSFYDSMYPLVPFLLVLIVLVLELVPVAVGGSLVGMVLSNGIAATTVERVMWIIVFLVSAGLSVWLLTFSVFALYIVTLPGMRPLQSLGEARRLTAGKRLNIIRKLLFLVCVLLLVSAVILVPVIILVAPATSAIMFVLAALALPFVHTYLYGLYRELLV